MKTPSQFFLDPAQPIATCTARTCQGCPAANVVHCHFHAAQLVQFILMVIPVFLVGAAGIWRSGGWPWFLGWLAFFLLYFGGLEIRVMCSHCPHYAEPGKSLKCWANYGSPKLWRYRPGPMSAMENTLFFAGFAVLFGIPLVFLILGSAWFLLSLYFATLAAFWSTMTIFLCSRCMNFACPLNRVSETDRQIFFSRNPSVSQAWGWEKKE